MKTTGTMLALMLAVAFGLGAVSVSAQSAVPDGAELEPLLTLLEDAGRSSPDGSLMVWVRYESLSYDSTKGILRPGDAAGVYLYGDGTIHWRLEEWTALPDGRYRALVWKFYRKAEPDRASLTEFIRDPKRPRVIEIPRYEEPVALDSPLAVEKSTKAFSTLLGADREALKRVPADAYMRPHSHDHGRVDL